MYNVLSPVLVAGIGNCKSIHTDLSGSAAFHMSVSKQVVCGFAMPESDCGVVVKYKGICAAWSVGVADHQPFCRAGYIFK